MISASIGRRAFPRRKRRGSGRPGRRRGELHGLNSCKGQGSCHGNGHSCAGMNGCKGQGNVKTTKEDAGQGRLGDRWAPRRPRRRRSATAPSSYWCWCLVAVLVPTRAASRGRNETITVMSTTDDRPPRFPIRASGLGLRREHYRHVLETRPAVDWFEVITENFMVAGGNPRRVLRAVRERLSGRAARRVAVDRLGRPARPSATSTSWRRWRATIEPAWISDHLCWGRRTAVTTRTTCCRCRTPRRRWRTSRARVQRGAGAARAADPARERVELPALHATSTMTEWRVPGRARASAPTAASCSTSTTSSSARTTTASTPRAYLAAMPAERVGQIHLAGHSDDGALLIDTHDDPVCDEVWQLYADAIERFGARADADRVGRAGPAVRGAGAASSTAPRTGRAGRLDAARSAAVRPEPPRRGAPLACASSATPCGARSPAAGRARAARRRRAR